LFQSLSPTKYCMYFYKFTQSRKGIVSTTAPLGQTTEIKIIGGVETEVRVQSNDVSFGFTAVSAETAAQMSIQVGDALPLVLTDKAVKNKEGEVIPNMFWAH